MHVPGAAAIGLVLVLTIGCGAGAGTVGPAAESSPREPAIATTTAPTASPTETPTPTPIPASPTPTPSDVANAAPPDLRGSWRGQVNGEPVELLLLAGTYRINRGGGIGAGRIAVTGDTIEFSKSNICDGAGRYTWRIDGDTLALMPVEPDACPGRADALVDVTYTLFMPLP